MDRRIRRAWFFARSFFCRPWTLDDYPVGVRRQDEPPAFVAMIDGMWITGFGDTPEAARAQLAERFDDYKAAHETLPRPGTQTPMVFASSARLEAHGPLRDEFIERILRMDAQTVFVSDGSSLGDFPGGTQEYARRIMLLYGIDIEALPDDDLATVLDAIADRPARGGRV